MAKKETKKDYLSDNLVLISSISITIFILTLSIINLKHYFTNLNVLGAKTETETNLSNESYWKEFLNQNSTYFDGWVELAKIEVGVENKELANMALLTAEKINPNSDKIIQLREEIKRLP
jgi:hypothetical protein